MENKITPELIGKAKQAKTPEELIDIAKINNVELTAEEAKTYFGQLNKTGELNDEELDNVSGGGCHTKDGRLVVAVTTCCEGYCHKSDNGTRYSSSVTGNFYCRVCRERANCGNCKYCTYEKGLWLCNNPANKE